jgi:hypothetical protein
MRQITIDEQTRAVGAVSRAGMSLLMICEQVTDPALQSQLNTILDDVRFANNVLYKGDDDARFQCN